MFKKIHKNDNKQQIDDLQNLQDLFTRNKTRSEKKVKLFVNHFQTFDKKISHGITIR